MPQVTNVDFIGIGSAKCGSTWVASALEEHPEILFSSQKSTKEIRFFNTAKSSAYKKDWKNSYDKGLDWYFDQFPEFEEGKIIGEFCTSYLVDEDAAKNIHKDFPNVKILVTLRNPIDMLYSLFWFCKATVEYRAPDTFEEFISIEGYADRGKYYKHLKRYFDLFPKERIHIIFQEDIKTKPDTVLEDLFSFLGVNKDFRPTMSDKVVGGAWQNNNMILRNMLHKVVSFFKKIGYENFVHNNFVANILYPMYMKLNLKQEKYTKLTLEDKQKYMPLFINDIEDLEKLLDVDLTHWKQL